MPLDEFVEQEASASTLLGIASTEPKIQGRHIAMALQRWQSSRIDFDDSRSLDALEPA